MFPRSQSYGHLRETQILPEIARLWIGLLATTEANSGLPVNPHNYLNSQMAFSTLTPQICQLIAYGELLVSG
jgi:hypothetical protein